MGNKYYPDSTKQKELEKVIASKPEKYVSSDSEAAERILTSLGKEKFSYTPESDPAYAAAKKQYGAAAEEAMKNTLGASAALTGGHLNSWGEVAAQREYERTMAAVTDIIPELYEAAYERYNDDRAAKLKQAEGYLDTDKQNYARYKNDFKNWQDARDYYYSLVRDDIEDQKDSDKYDLDLRKLLAAALQ